MTAPTDTIITTQAAEIRRLRALARRMAGEARRYRREAEILRIRLRHAKRQADRGTAARCQSCGIGYLHDFTTTGARNRHWRKCSHCGRQFEV